MAKGVVVASLPHEIRTIRAVKFSPDGQLLLRGRAGTVVVLVVVAASHLAPDCSALA